MKPIKLAGLNALLALALLGAACTPAAAPTPTLDPNVLYTAAAQTVIAQLTQNAPPPTATVAPTQTKAVTATRLAGLPTFPPLGTLSPLKTATSQLSAGGDKCVYYSQSPADSSSVKTSSTFNVIWKIKNVGITTWGSGYYWRFYSASNKLGTSQSLYEMTTTTAPNAIADITVVATAPSSAGAVDTSWVLTNPQGVNFCSFNVKVNVIASAAASEATAVPATEAEVFTFSEGDLDVGGLKAVDDHSWASSTVTYTGGNTPRQARIYYSINKNVPTTALVSFVGNNGVWQQASQYGDTSSGTLPAGLVSGSAYTFTITKDADTDARVSRLEVCVSTVDCW